MMIETSTQPPGPALQFLNRILHKKPLSFIVYGIYWWFFCCVLSPLAGCVLLIWTSLRTIFFFVSLPFTGGRSIINPSSDIECELAVVITGCDSGFGRDLALELSDKGFIVFAGVLMNESMTQYKENKRITAVQMDVTNDQQVEVMAEHVSKWINALPKQRYLHGLVNNAGVASGGEIDWLDLSAFKRDMEVNYFGMIRTTKAFFPIFKQQACTSKYNDARVMNVVSMAGLGEGPLLASYNGSKHAAEVFSSCLRHEMKHWRVKVVTVNPSYHETPLVASMGRHLINFWNKLPSTLKKEYGEDYMKQSYKNSVDMSTSVTWKANVVLEEMLDCIQAKYPPRQLIIGTDAKFAMLPLRHLPVWLKENLMSIAVPRTVKPAVLTKSISSKED